MNNEFKSLLPPNASKLLRDLEKTGSRLSFLEILNRYLRNPENVRNIFCRGWVGLYRLTFGMKHGPNLSGAM